MNINKDEDALVIIKNKGEFSWFAAFKEMWVLDRIKWISDFIQHGIESVNLDDHKERYAIAIVDETNVADFIHLLRNDGYLFDKEDIANEFYKRLSLETTWWDIYDLLPDLFIDFDSRRLYSEYVESIHYEQYVPDGWGGELVDFCKNGTLPDHEMFWIRNGMDYRSEIILKGNQF
ncbi:TPA: hypothetical protein ACKP1B_000406 [Serratia fonticola]